MKLKDEASAGLEKVKGGLGGVNLGAIALGGAAVVAVGALAMGIFDCAKAAGEEEVGIKRMETAVKKSGAEWNAASKDIEAYLTSALRRVALDDGAGRE
jgi:hypothetical protein